MAHLRFTDGQDRPTEFLDFTSLTLDEFQLLVPPFEAAFHAHMHEWRLDGKPRTARQFRVYQNCPLPTPEDRLFFILTYLKTYALQVVQGRLFGMGQSKANQWIHVLLPALLAALRALGDAPARSLTALAQRLRLCRKFAFETICAMVSPGNLRCIERENDDGDQFQGRPFSAGYHPHGCAVVCRLSLELPTCRRAHAGTRCAGRPRDHSALGREIQPPIGSGISSSQAVGVAQLAPGRNVHQGEGPVALSLSRRG